MGEIASGDFTPLVAGAGTVVSTSRSARDDVCALKMLQAGFSSCMMVARRLGVVQLLTVSGGCHRQHASRKWGLATNKALTRQKHCTAQRSPVQRPCANMDCGYSISAGSTTQARPQGAAEKVWSASGYVMPNIPKISMPPHFPGH